MLICARMIADLHGTFTFNGHSSTTMLLHTTGPALNALAGIGSAAMLADVQEGTKAEISSHSWIAGK